MPSSDYLDIPYVGPSDSVKLSTVLNGQVTAIDTGVKEKITGLDASLSADIKMATQVLRGTAAERAATPSDRYWQFWIDTDGFQGVYVSDKTGGWRRYCAAASVPAGAWSTAKKGIAQGRSVNVTIPTRLLTTETVMISATYVGTGFGFISVVAIARNPGNTVLTIRQMQLLSEDNKTNPFSFAWQILPDGDDE